MKPLALISIALSLLAGCARRANDRVLVPDSYGSAYAVGGHVRGLDGIGLTLRSVDGEEVKIEADGKFVFGRRLDDRTAYAVTIVREPISPVQACIVERASGRIEGRNAMDIEVVCSTVTFDGATPEMRAMASR